MTYAAPISTRQEKHPGPARYARPDAERLRNWLWGMFGRNEGWLDLGYIEGDPKERPMRRAGWHYYTPNDLGDLVERCCALVEQYGNAYHSIGLYREPRRDIEALSFLPGVFVDDYPGNGEMPASALLETSRRNYQAFWLVPGGIDAATFRALGKAMARATSGGANSCNAAHIVRFPGSINTKPGKDNFAARHHANPTHPRYTVEQLRAAFPQASDAGPVAAPDLTSEQREQIDYWRENATHLLNDEGLPRRFRSPKGQARLMLTGKIKAVAGDGSSSMRRAVLMRGLLLHGYPMPEAVALAMHLVKPARGQDDTWLLTDALRLFERERVKLGEKYAPSASRPKGQNSPVKNHQNTPEPPRPRGRPKEDTLSADVLYDWFCTEAVGTPARVLCTVDDVAQELGVPRSQVERAERELRERGLIERGAKRHNSWVELPHFRPFKNPQRTKGRAVPAPKPETDDGAAQCKERGYTGETQAPHSRPTGASVPPQTPSRTGATSASPGTLRLREPANVVERRERQARLRLLNAAQLEQRRHELLGQARQSFKLWELRELEAQAREVEAELGQRRDESLVAMLAQAEQEADRPKQQAQPAPAQRAAAPPSAPRPAPVREEGEAEHDFALVAVAALPADETRRHIADARRIAVPRTTEAAYAHLRRKLHGKASIEALRDWTEAEKARKLAEPDWIDVCIA
jgi:hypothetical protein